MTFSKAIGYLATVAVLSGCAGHDSGPVPEPAALMNEDLQSATFRGVLDSPVTLVDGRYEGEPFTPGAASRPVIRLVPDMTATGDLTGDGDDEAVVVLAHNAGGSGVSIYLAVLQGTRHGPENIATVRLGDRVKVLSLEIHDGKLAAQLVEHGPKDPMCCPTKKVRREWSLEGHELAEIRQAPGPTAGRVRGHLVWGHETRSFVECDTGREAWVFNDSGDELTSVYEELTASPYQPMFVEVRGAWEDAPTEGFGAVYGEALRVREFLRAESEGFGCRLDLDGVLFVASGNEPSWRAHVRKDGVSLRSMDSPEEIVFAPPESSKFAGRVTYYSSDSRNGKIRITLEQGRCVDSMSGARYAWSATVDIDGRRLAGCAVEGL